MSVTSGSRAPEPRPSRWPSTSAISRSRAVLTELPHRASRAVEGEGQLAIGRVHQQLVPELAGHHTGHLASSAALDHGRLGRAGRRHAALDRRVVVGRTGRWAHTSLWGTSLWGMGASWWGVSLWLLWAAAVRGRAAARTTGAVQPAWMRARRVNSASRSETSPLGAVSGAAASSLSRPGSRHHASSLLSRVTFLIRSDRPSRRGGTVPRSQAPPPAQPPQPVRSRRA